MQEKYNFKKIAIIGFLANVLEWYDFSVYAYLASVIGKIFFAEENKELALIKSFSIFSVSYLVRPLGGCFFGYIGDKFGRKISLQLSLIIMAFSTFFIGLLPVYQTGGFLAAAMLIFLRMVQGFSAGGELPISNCYIYEISNKKYRNFLCSFVASSSMFGVFLGSFTVFIIYEIFSISQIYDLAWRIPFLIGSILALIIFKLRNSIEETKQFKKNVLINKNNFLKLLFMQKNKIIPLIFINSFVSIAFYLLFVWMPSYLKVFMKISSNLAYLSSSFSLLILILLTLFVGFISKENQNKKWLFIGISLLIVTSYPLFKLINQKSIIFIVIAQLMFAISLSCIDGVINSTMGNLFNNRIRCTGISIGFTLPTAIFGGLAPTVCSFLIYKTNSYASPVLFLVISGIIALLALTQLRY